MLFTQKTAPFHNKSEMRSRKCVFLWLGESIRWEILTLDEPNILLYFQLHFDRPPQLLLQHLVIAEPLLLAFGSIFATSSLRESPDDRISSLPLRWQQRHNYKHTATGRSDCVYCVYFNTHVLYSIPTRLMPLTARTRSPVLSFWHWAAGESGTTDFT